MKIARVQRAIRVPRLGQTEVRKEQVKAEIRKGDVLRPVGVASKVGRPSKYDPLMCELVIELGLEGASFCEMAVRLGICVDTFNEYRKKYPEFSVAVKQANDLARTWWEISGRDHTFGGKQMNQTAYIFTMKNRWPDDYKDRKEISVSGNVTVSTVNYAELEKKQA